MKGADPRAECDRVSASWGRDRTPLTTRRLACLLWAGRSRTLTHVYIEDAQGRRVTRGIVATKPTGLAGAVERDTARGVRVAIEAGNPTAWMVDLLRELGATVHVVHSLPVKLIAESKKKTDRIDA
jgi:hypothetical protein